MGWCEQFLMLYCFEYNCYATIYYYLLMPEKYKKELLLWAIVLKPPQNDSIETNSAPNVCLGSNIYCCSNFKVMFPKSQSVKQAISFTHFLQIVNKW